MSVVVKRTGLTHHVIRVWEKRYRAVTPQRSSGRQRLYSEEDITRLSLLALLTRDGYKIRHLAPLHTERLRELAHWESSETSDLPETKPGPSADRIQPRVASFSKRFVLAAMRNVNDFDRHGLEKTLAASAVKFGVHGLVEKVVAPLTQQIGDAWRDGSLSAAHEHFASAVIRNVLLGSHRPFAPGRNAPNVVVATPSGQLHELGAVIVAAAAGDIGWNVTYLGASLPAADIASASVSSQAKVVALSLVYPEDDPGLPRELELLREYLPSSVALIVGGRAAPAYAATLGKIGARMIKNLTDFYEELTQIREFHRLGARPVLEAV